jgi:hypothetical protein
MKQLLVFLAMVGISVGCTFKGEIEDKTGGGNETPFSPDNNSQEGIRLGTLKYYGFHTESGMEISRAFGVVKSDDGELSLDAPIVLPPGVSTGAFNLSGFEGRVVDLAKLTTESLEELGSLKRLSGSGTDQVEYKLDSKALLTSGAKYLFFQISNEPGESQFIKSELYVAPQDLTLNVSAPASSQVRDSSKDIFSEKGTLFHLHDLIIQNNKALSIDAEIPMVLSANYLVRRYEDMTVPNHEARSVDKKECGSAVSISRRYPESRTQQLGLFLIPKSIRLAEQSGEYLDAATHIYQLSPGESILFEVYVLGRPDLEVAKQIFASHQSQKRTVMSGCKSKKDYYEPPGCDNGRVYSESQFLSQVSSGPRIQCGRYRYYGVPIYSEWVFQSGISKVFLSFSDQRNSKFKIRPSGGYQDSILNYTPRSINNQRLLYSNGVE